MNKLVILLLLILCSCKPSPQLLWRFKTQGPIYGSPGIAGKLLIVGSNDHFVYALDLDSGKQVWKQNLGETLWSKPLFHDGAIFIGSGNGYFFCLEPLTGKIRWKFKTGELIHYDACGDKTGVYFGSNDGHFYKLGKDGQMVWSHDTAGFNNWGTCVFYKNLVIANSWDTNFYALDRNTGEVVWKVSSGQFNYGSPELAGDQVYFGTHDSLYRLDAQTGKMLSKTKTTYVNYALVFQNYLWTNEEGLTKRTLDGAPIATVKFNSFSHCRPEIVHDYFIVHAQDSLYAVSPELKILWKFKGEDSFWSPGVAGGNAYYAGNRDGSVYALRLPVK